MTSILKRISLGRFNLRWYHLVYILVGIAILVYIGYFIIYNIYAFSLFKFPFDYDQGEGFELMDTVLFSRGKWPYQDINTYPFYSSNYPPVFHLVVVPLVWLFGPQYWTGRVVAYLGTLVTAGAIGYAVHRHGKRWWLSIIAGLVFLASNYIYHIGPLFRQHLFMVMFETLSVVVLTVFIEREEQTGNRNNTGLILVLGLLLLAGYTKQLAYATVASVFIFLFLRQTRRAILWALPFAAATAVIFTLINLATDGQWLTNTITANLNPFVPGQTIGLFKQWFKLHLIITLVAIVMALYQLYFDRLSAYAIWFVVAVVNSISAGKWGAGESYFATAIAASVILTGLAFNRLLDWTQKRNRGLYAASVAVLAVLLLIQANAFFHMPTGLPVLKSIASTLGKPTEVLVAPQTSCSAPRPAVPVPYVDSAGVGLLGRPVSEKDTAAGIAVANIISEGNTAAFSEEAGFNLYAGRDVVTNPTQLLNLYNNGQVDLTEMLNLLDSQAFDFVVLRAQFYPPPVLESIGRAYNTEYLVEMNGFVYCILTPRDSGT